MLGPVFNTILIGLSPVTYNILSTGEILEDEVMFSHH